VFPNGIDSECITGLLFGLVCYRMNAKNRRVFLLLFLRRSHVCYNQYMKLLIIIARDDKNVFYTYAISVRNLRVHIYIKRFALKAEFSPFTDASAKRY